MTKTNLAAIPEPEGIADPVGKNESGSPSTFFSEARVPVGEYAPAFILPHRDGGNLGIVELVGAPFVLLFYSGSGERLQQTACLDATAPTLGILGVALVGIVCAERGPVRSQFEPAAEGYPVLLDWEPLVSRLYGFNRDRAAPEISATYLADLRGVVSWVEFDRAKERGDSAIILNAVRFHLSRPSTLDTSD